MYHPTTRLLTILELLQAHPSLSGEALSRRLEVEPRSIRRYITMLQDMGMPIEAVRGPGGGYQLRPGFKLPPLMFSEEEATALVLGLLGTPWLEIGQSSVAVEGALAKVLRVLPLRARARLNAMTANLVLSPNEHEGRPAAALLLDLSEAIQQRQCIAIEYRSHHDQVTHRTVEPYGLAGWWSYWYLVGYCRLRQGYRLFRLDRLQGMQVLEQHFTRAGDFDVEAYLREQLGWEGAHAQITVEFQATLHAVQQKIPTGYGTLAETPTGVLFETQYGDIADVARFLVSRNLPFVVHGPPELRAELLQMAERITHSAMATQRQVE
ncbi:MAG: YafY family transcriptional regulator [Roseiflexaceae bacterium]|nr:YafY family transcriptional regulator [Roseiflexaceae bacterium]